MVLTDDILSLRISTDAFPEKDRVEAFRENLGKAILRVEMDPLGDDPFEFDMTMNALPGFGMATGSVSPVRNRHGNELIDNDDVVFVFLDCGDATLQQNGNGTAVREGDAVITENNEPATFTGHSKTRTTNLRFNRDRLLPLLAAGIGDSLDEPKLKSSAALELLKQYAAVVQDGVSLSLPQTRRLIVEHFYDLAALAIGANKDSGNVAKRRGLRAARLHTIKMAVLKNLGNRDLSATALAERQGITQRYVQMLFEAEGTTFSEFLLAQRLKRAHRLLSDPAFRTHSISAIAFDVGFNDLSYFNRTFRRMFGATPSDIRGAAKTPDSGRPKR